MNFFNKYLDRTVLVLLFMLAVALLIVPHFESIPREARFHVVLIVCISFVCAILLFFLFLTPFGFGNITELIRFAHALQVLKRDDVQKSLSELKELSSVTQALWEKLDIGILPDCSNHVRNKEVTKEWILGAPLRLAENNIEDILDRLGKNVTYKFLCIGTKSRIEDRAKKIAKRIYAKEPKYIWEDAIIIAYLGAYQVHLPMTIYNVDEPGQEVIFFPYDLGSDREKKCGIVLKDKHIISSLTEKFEEDLSKATRLPLEEYCTKE